MAEQTARIGRRIAEARLAAGLTQDELAARIPGKANGTQISKWERGIHRPGDDTLEQIGLAVDRDVSWFLLPEPAKEETPDPFAGRGARSEDYAALGKRLEGIEQMVDEIREMLLAAEVVRFDDADKTRTGQPSRTARPKRAT